MDLANKLQLKESYRLTVKYAPKDLKLNLPGGKGEIRAHLIFIKDMKFLKAQAKFLKSIPSAEMLWLAYQKGGKGELNRDVLHKELKALGWEGVRLIAVDNNWSAMRFKKV